MCEIILARGGNDQIPSKIFFLKHSNESLPRSPDPCRVSSMACPYGGRCFPIRRCAYCIPAPPPLSLFVLVASASSIVSSFLLPPIYFPPPPFPKILVPAPCILSYHIVYPLHFPSLAPICHLMFPLPSSAGTFIVTFNSFDRVCFDYLSSSRPSFSRFQVPIALNFDTLPCTVTVGCV